MNAQYRDLELATCLGEGKIMNNNHVVLVDKLKAAGGGTHFVPIYPDLVSQLHRSKKDMVTDNILF